MLVILGELSGLGGATLSLSFEATLGGSLGLAGVGKSALAREAIHYVLERRYFGGGVIHIDCNNVR